MGDLEQGNFFRLQSRCRRKFPRKRAFSAAVLVEDCRSEPCFIRDMSPAGAQIRFSATRSIPRETYLINLKSRYAHHAHPVWHRQSLAGLRFDGGYEVNHLLPLHVDFLNDQMRTATLRLMDQMVLRGIKFDEALRKCGITHEIYWQWRGTSQRPQ